VPREDLVIDLHGAAVGVLLREMCSVDFLPLLDTAGSDAGPVVLTSMIGVAVTALPRRMEGRGALTLWLDRSFAHYFLTTLFEVADGHGGAAVQQSTGTQE
jgi:sarcosine oxidase subunit gamma